MGDGGIIRRFLERAGLYLTVGDLLLPSVFGLTIGGVAAKFVSAFWELGIVPQAFFGLATAIVVFWLVGLGWQRYYGPRVSVLFDDDEPGPEGLVVIQNDGARATFSASAEILGQVGGDPNPVRQNHFIPPWMSTSDSERTISANARAQLHLVSSRHPRDLDEHSPEWYRWSEMVFWQLDSGEKGEFQARKWPADPGNEPPAFRVNLRITRLEAVIGGTEEKEILVKGGDTGGVLVTPPNSGTGA